MNLELKNLALLSCCVLLFTHSSFSNGGSGSENTTNETGGSGSGDLVSTTNETNTTATDSNASSTLPDHMIATTTVAATTATVSLITTTLDHDSAIASSFMSTTISTTTMAPITSTQDDDTTPAADAIESDLLSITDILWLILACLIALIIITLFAICLVSAAHFRRHKRTKQPTMLDVLSKWEDTPNESSEIQLLSIKTIEDGDDNKDGENIKNGEAQNGGEAEIKEQEKEASAETIDKAKVLEVRKEDDITVGTFGFAEKVAEPTAADTKLAVSTTVTLASEEKLAEEQSKKIEAVNKEKNEKVVVVTIEKGGDPSVGPKEKLALDVKNAPFTSVVLTEKEKAVKIEPVPVQIPKFGKKITDDKLLDVKKEAEVTTIEQTDKPESSSLPKIDQAFKPEVSLSSKDASATESVSKEPEPPATNTKPQTEEATTVLASEKVPTATVGLSLFTNEDMEKALGIAASGGPGRLESTQL